jgi:hypothetical protein
VANPATLQAITSGSSLDRRDAALLVLLYAFALRKGPSAGY